MNMVYLCVEQVPLIEKSSIEELSHYRRWKEWRQAVVIPEAGFYKCAYGKNRLDETRSLQYCSVRTKVFL